MIKRTHILLITIAVCLWTGSATAASFPCDSSPSQPGEPRSASAQPQNLTVVEKMICDDQKASMLDEKVSGLFWLSKKLSSDSPQTSTAQKKWLKEQRDVCKTAACVIAAYEARYADLKQQISKRLRTLPQETSWYFTTPPVRSPDSYCARFADRKMTSDIFKFYLMHDGKTICGQGAVGIDCGRRIQEITPIRGYLEDRIGWLEFDGAFSWDFTPNLWRALIAFDGKKLYWKIVHKTEVESYIELGLLLDPDDDVPSDVVLKELKESCAQKNK